MMCVNCCGTTHTGCWWAQPQPQQGRKCPKHSHCRKLKIFQACSKLIYFFMKNPAFQSNLWGGVSRFFLKEELFTHNNTRKSPWGASPNTVSRVCLVQADSQEQRVLTLLKEKKKSGAYWWLSQGKTRSFQRLGAAKYTFYKTKVSSQKFEWLFLAIDKPGISKIGSSFFYVRW